MRKYTIFISLFFISCSSAVIQTIPEIGQSVIIPYRSEANLRVNGIGISASGSSIISYQRSHYWFQEDYASIQDISYDEDIYYLDQQPGQYPVGFDIMPAIEVFPISGFVETWTFLQNPLVRATSKKCAPYFYDSNDFMKSNQDFDHEWQNLWWNPYELNMYYFIDIGAEGRYLIVGLFSTLENQIREDGRFRNPVLIRCLKENNLYNELYSLLAGRSALLRNNLSDCQIDDEQSTITCTLKYDDKAGM